MAIKLCFLMLISKRGYRSELNGKEFQTWLPAVCVHTLWASTGPLLPADAENNFGKFSSLPTAAAVFRSSLESWHFFSELNKFKNGTQGTSTGECEQLLAK